MPLNKVESSLVHVKMFVYSLWSLFLCNSVHIYLLDQIKHRQSPEMGFLRAEPTIEQGTFGLKRSHLSCLSWLWGCTCDYQGQSIVILYISTTVSISVCLDNSILCMCRKSSCLLALCRNQESNPRTINLELSQAPVGGLSWVKEEEKRHGGKGQQKQEKRHVRHKCKYNKD